jgi:nucleoside 2-deoxyribosyltransferase
VESDRRRVYVASPLGFTEPTRGYYAEVLLPGIRAAGIEPLDPWDPPFDDLTVALALPPGEGRQRRLAAANQRLGAHNAALIHAADAVFAVFDGQDVDSGTAAEIGYAAALGKPVVAWRSDLRRIGDNDATMVNLQVEYFVTMCGGSLHHDLGSALAALAALLP